MVASHKGQRERVLSPRSHLVRAAERRERFFLDRQSFVSLYERWQRDRDDFRAKFAESEAVRGRLLFSEAIRKKDADINFKMTDIQAQNLVIESMAAELLNGPLSDYFSRYGDINLNGIRDLYLGGRVSEAEYAPVGKIEEAIRELNATNSTLNPMMSDLIKT